MSDKKIILKVVEKWIKALQYVSGNEDDWDLIVIWGKDKMGVTASNVYWTWVFTSWCFNLSLY